MADKTTGRVATDTARRRKLRHNRQNLRNLEHQVQMMREFNIPNKEDELEDMRAELAANEERLEELRAQLAKEEADG